MRHAIERAESSETTETIAVARLEEEKERDNFNSTSIGTCTGR